MTNEEAPAPGGRKFLLISPMKNPVVVWIDDEGTCAPPVCKGGDHHLYADEFGRKWAFRCPKSISSADQERVFRDLPAGCAREQVKEYRVRVSEAARQQPRRSHSHYGGEE